MARKGRKGVKMLTRAGKGQKENSYIISAEHGIAISAQHLSSTGTRFCRILTDYVGLVLNYSHFLLIMETIP